MGNWLIEDLGLGKQYHDLKDITSVFEIISAHYQKPTEEKMPKTQEVKLDPGVESLVIVDVNGGRTTVDVSATNWTRPDWFKEGIFIKSHLGLVGVHKSFINKPNLNKSDLDGIRPAEVNDFEYGMGVYIGLKRAIVLGTVDYNSYKLSVAIEPEDDGKRIIKTVFVWELNAWAMIR